MAAQREDTRTLASWSSSLKRLLRGHPIGKPPAHVCHGIVHIPKCAGSSLRVGIGAIPGCYSGPKYFDTAHFGSERIAEGVGPVNSPQIATPEELAEIVATHRLVIGHYSLHSLVQSGCGQISLQVREPRARLLSLYRYWQNDIVGQTADWGLWGTELVAKSDLPLIDFLGDPAVRPAIDNQIARTILSPSDPVATPDHYPDVAGQVHALRHHLAVVAWTTQSGEFFTDVAELIGEPEPPRLERTNVTEGFREAQVIDHASIERLNQLTSSDRLVLNQLCEVSSLPARSPSDLDAEFEATATRLGFSIQ